VNIESLKGSGPGGRVTEADVLAAISLGSASTVAPVANPVAAAATSIEPFRTPGSIADFHWQELTPVQRVTGERMRESVLNAPQFALDIHADATNLLWLKQALDDKVALEAKARLSLTGLLAGIVADAITRHPRVNSQFADGKIKLLDAINVGIAVGTDQGLVVPVIKDAAHKSLAEITAELASHQEKARTLHFSAADLEGGTFTISNLGMYGIERFAALLNPPQSAILAVGAVVPTPVALDGEHVSVRPMMALTLTVDHRVLDGLQAARFLAELKQLIEKPYFLI
jgi:pyruvate dehydrogenase E2 component (dihydrolipoamide acetyltransferase)